MEITYIKEPTDLQCGQAVLAMVSGKSVDEIVKMLGNDRETTLKEMKDSLDILGFEVSSQRFEAHSKDQLPELAMLSLETPRCWHWSLYHEGLFYDPEHGVLQDFPICRRKFYWKLTMR